MDAIDLIRLQITLEYALNDAGRLVPFSGSSEQGLYIVYRYAGGYIPYYNQCLSEELCSGLRNLGGEQAFEAPQAVLWLIQKHQSCQFDGSFVSAHLSRHPGQAEFPRVVRQGDAFVILEGGAPVCRAWSERSNAHCAEVAVETHPDHQRKGYARQAVAAWAHDVIQSGRVALYSYKAENNASRALARSLKAVWYAEVVCYS